MDGVNSGGGVCPQKRMCCAPRQCAWMLTWHAKLQKTAGTHPSCEYDTYQYTSESLHCLCWAQVQDMLRKYCLAVAAKDCSIMVSYTTEREGTADSGMHTAVMDCVACKDDADRLRCMLEPAEHQAGSPTHGPCEQPVHTCIGSVCIGQQVVRYRVGVVDMDRKSIGKVESHMKLDREILQAWNRDHTV